MPEEAFALSPIAARPSLPSEADYEAIREAFMETARGRWFLSEYAKRNRNADTRMVLDAVERIELSIAAQKQTNANGLVDALGAISALIGDTKTTVAQALPDPAELLAGAREGARVTRKVATALRDCGADVRICDLLDTQVDAIEAGHQQLAAMAPRETVLAAFDRLLQGVVDLASGTATSRTDTRPDAPPPGPPPAAAAAFSPPESPAAAPEGGSEIAATTVRVEPVEAASGEPAASVAVDDTAAAPGIVFETALDDTALHEAAVAETALSETAVYDAAPDDAAAEEASLPDGDAVFSAEIVAVEEFEVRAAIEIVEDQGPTLEQIVADEAAGDAEAAHDIAMLDIVAQEMAAPDDDDMADFDSPAPIGGEPAAASLVDIAEMPEPTGQDAPAFAAPAVGLSAAPAPLVHAAAPEPPAAVTGAEPAAAPAAAPASLGAAVLAHGVVRKPVLGSDPLAALRRMTQAEKLAFFS